ncbi:hypothetical protein PanWU01x14_345630, partial [Parasponia andersonii]
AELLLAGAPNWVDHVKRLRIRGSHHSLEAGSHVHKVAVGEDSGADGDGLHVVEDGQVGEGESSSDGEPHLSAVAVHGPDRDPEEGAFSSINSGVTVALESYSEEPVLHLPCQIGSRDREFKEQQRGAAAVLLQAEADAALPVAEEGACECELTGSGSSTTGGLMMMMIRGGGAGGGGEGVLAVPIAI